jgi:uncharacterized protein (DUF2237 family)
MMLPKLALFSLFLASGGPSVAMAESSKNVYGEALQKCSQSGMALTGFTRTGHCQDYPGDHGSHHVCVDIAGTTGGNFCTVTGQPNWCSSSNMPCTEDASKQCPIQNWCVCEWAFSSYIQKAGGCDKISHVQCNAINKKTIDAYEQASLRGDEKARQALECLKNRCQLDKKTSTA